jgi:hypothetical protein
MSSCLGPGYDPQPPRAWSRVQNICSSSVNANSSGYVSSPLTGELIPVGKYYFEAQMLLKGNVLQYKKNSTSLTKRQRYAQIAKGQWTNRTKTWATQTETYSNPNTTSLLRVGYIEAQLPTNATDPFNCQNPVYRDGGSLVCNTLANPCTNTPVARTINNRCFPSSDSNVPGRMLLCWNPGIATWYDKKRYTMNNSGNKWPQNYKGFRSANAIKSNSTI